MQCTLGRSLLWSTGEIRPPNVDRSPRDTWRLRRWARRDLKLFGYKPWYPSRNASLPSRKAYGRIVRQWADTVRPLVEQKRADRKRPGHRASKGHVRKRDQPDADADADAQRGRKKRRQRKKPERSQEQARPAPSERARVVAKGRQDKEERRRPRGRRSSRSGSRRRKAATGDEADDS